MCPHKTTKPETAITPTMTPHTQTSLWAHPAHKLHAAIIRKDTLVAAETRSTRDRGNITANAPASA
ncbi:MAG: hypothetical protein ABF746_08405 [Acetobacter orientalis]|uniref:hypothetical protein n=1 Tax=Acetobacter orientalis TaxID=146474 RepID=UPI0020A52557|nr:hypothetical protein [Acetobacter orientalis]MCP1221719.1 hypothetical protein [Acetobacter orientalis]